MQLLLDVFDSSLNFLGQVEPIPLAKLDQSVQVPHCLGPQRALLNFFLQPEDPLIHTLPRACLPVKLRQLLAASVLAA